MWAYGDTVLYRYGRRAEARFVRLGRVIADDQDGLVLWIAPGSPQVESLLADGTTVRSLPLDQRAAAVRERRHTTWRGPGIVQYTPVVGDWSVWWFFTPDGEFAGWYGNLESPRVRWAAGVDATDRALDVWITPDRVARWKDEDEFAAMTGTPGRWTVEQVPAIRAAGEHLIALAAAGASPFDGRWTDYRPDPAWEPVEMPDHWDRPHLATP
ncbi:DUF402 domain-containing protein [Actinoplanes sp. NBRC 103695]|uniref:DUF402 domain-containing protein n=1 Tax=Actinoplanes sp. NBRC 103695 TaxID=3032202 RepID=UPI0024A0B2A8|nr:DUF402 domain-containing protein [Actinoplanes sp. NBRC 103695]GLY94979.1 hypothetical protein Acsp02_22340 [Actinoplanes sp. NBRC 103695]